MIHEARPAAPRSSAARGSRPRVSRSTIAASSASIWCRLGLLATCVPGTFDALMLVLRSATMARSRCARRWNRRSIMRAMAIPWSSASPPRSTRCASSSREEWPTSAALYLPGGAPPAPGSLFRNETLADTYERAADRGRERRRRPRAADREGTADLVAGLHRRCDRRLLPPRGADGFLRQPQPRRAHGRRHGPLAGQRRGAGRLRLRTLPRAEARRLVPGDRHAAAARPAQGLPSRRHGRARTGFRASRSSRRRSSPSPTATRSWAIPPSSMCRSM